MKIFSKIYTLAVLEFKELVILNHVPRIPQGLNNSKNWFKVGLKIKCVTAAVVKPVKTTLYSNPFQKTTLAVYALQNHHYTGCPNKHGDYEANSRQFLLRTSALRLLEYFLCIFESKIVKRNNCTVFVNYFLSFY